MLPGILFLIAIIAAIIHLGCRKKSRSNARVLEIFLAYMIPLTVGIMEIIAWVGHVFYAEKVAMMMGWQLSPFQFEVGMACLGFGVVGILSLWQRKGFWLATVLAYGIFHIGGGIGFYRMMQENSAHWNGFMVFINCILIPVVLIVLTWIYSKQNKYFKG